MKPSRIFAVAALGFLTGCGGVGVGSPAPHDGLLVRVPNVPAAAFESSMTMDIDVDSPMGALQLGLESEGVLAVGFAADPAGIRATATFESFAGTMSNPMGADVHVSDADIEGALVFTVSPDGTVSMIEDLVVPGAAGQIVRGGSAAQELFPRFPLRDVLPGDSWVDTIDITESGEMEMTQVRVVTYTLQGDSLFAGTPVQKLLTEADITMTMSGEQAGMKMTQTLQGSSTGWVLWDGAAGLALESVNETQLSGKISVGMPGVPDMKLSARGRQSTVRIR